MLPGAQAMDALTKIQAHHQLHPGIVTVEIHLAQVAETALPTSMKMGKSAPNPEHGQEGMSGLLQPSFGKIALQQSQGQIQVIFHGGLNHGGKIHRAQRLRPWQIAGFDPLLWHRLPFRCLAGECCGQQYQAQKPLYHRRTATVAAIPGISPGAWLRSASARILPSESSAPRRDSRAENTLPGRALNRTLKGSSSLR